MLKPPALPEDTFTSTTSREANQVFPLYLCPDRNEIESNRRPNFSPKFLKDITVKLGYTPTPEAIFYYTYAVFHSPTYGDRTVAPGHPKYKNGKVIINKQGDGFVGVPEDVWNFHVGGYQVCHKWLKDRKGRTLSDDDILHYQRIVVALKETITLMQKIDDAIPSWPIE